MISGLNSNIMPREPTLQNKNIILKKLESLFMPDGSKMSIMKTVGIFQSIPKNPVESGVSEKDNSCNGKIIAA